MRGGLVGPGMRSYYDRRAPEYDDWWRGTGLFARRERPGWHEEVDELIAVLSRLEPASTLDLACGTGFLTRHLPGEVVAIDQSRSMVEIAAARLPGLRVRYGDAGRLPFVDGSFDRVFSSHFYGHLLPEEREVFLGEARRVGRTLVIAEAARRRGPAEEWQERILDDGSRHRVYKRFFTPAELLGELGGGDVLHDGRWFVVAAA